MEKLPGASLPIGHYTDFRSKSNMKFPHEHDHGFTLN